MKKLVSIVAPMYNEEELCHEFCCELIKSIHLLESNYDFEVVMVDDGSKDNTYSIMLEEQRNNPAEITTISLSRNFGLEGAVDAGIRAAKGDAVIVMDADLQDPPALIPEMINKWQNGADIVVGSRVKRNYDGFFKRKGAELYYDILNAMSGKIQLEKNAANFRLLSRRALEQVLNLSEVNGVFRVVVPFVGMKTDVIEYERDKRYAGKSKYKLKTMIPYALDSITGISTKPLRMIMWFVPVCMIICIFAIIMFFLTTGYWKAFFAILIFMSLFFGMALAAMVIIAEYVGQIMIETKKRPSSIIYEYNPCQNAINTEKT